MDRASAAVEPRRLLHQEASELTAELQLFSCQRNSVEIELIQHVADQLGVEAAHAFEIWVQ